MCKAIVVANETNSAKKAFGKRLESIGLEVAEWVRLDRFLNGHVRPEGVELVIFNAPGVEGKRLAVEQKAKPLPCVTCCVRSSRNRYAHQHNNNGSDLAEVEAWMVEKKSKRAVEPVVEVQAEVVSEEPQHEAKATDGPTAEIVRVPFDGGFIDAVKREDGIWSVFKPMCEALGIDADAQWRRILRESWSKSTTVKLAVVAADGKTREMNAIRADMIPAWLVGVQTGSIREELRPKLDRFKNEAAKVLAAYFTPEAAGAAGVDVEAIGMAIAATGKALKEQKQALLAQDARIAQLEQQLKDVSFDVQGIKPKSLPYQPSLPDTDATDVYDAIAKSARDATDKAKPIAKWDFYIFTRAKEIANKRARRVAKVGDGRLNSKRPDQLAKVLAAVNEPTACGEIVADLRRLHADKLGLRIVAEAKNA